MPDYRLGHIRCIHQVEPTRPSFAFRSGEGRTQVDTHARIHIDNYLTALLREKNFDQKDYFQELTRTIIALWHHGPCVFLGRGAAHTLPPEYVLSVSIVAPETDRIRRTEHLDGLNRGDARKKIVRKDAEREEFIRKHHGRDIHDILIHDIVLNTKNLTVEACARIVADAYRLRFGEQRVENEPDRPSVYDELV